MRVNAEIDLRSWEKSTARIYALLRKKTLPDIINRSAGSIALNAARYTAKASRIKLQRKYFSMPRLPTGLTRKQRAEVMRKRQQHAANVSDVGRKIFAARLIREGRNPRALTSEAFGREIVEWAKQRVAAAGFLRFGWIDAASNFLPWMKTKGLRIARRGVRRIGLGKPAAGGTWNPTAMLENRAVIKHESMRPMMVAALSRAVDRETAMLEKQAETIMRRDLKTL